MVEIGLATRTNEACVEYNICPVYGFDGLYIGRQDPFIFQLDWSQSGKYGPFKIVRPFRRDRNGLPWYRLTTYRGEEVEIGFDQLATQTFYGPLDFPIIQRFSSFDNCTSADFRYIIPAIPEQGDINTVIVANTQFKVAKYGTYPLANLYISDGGALLSMPFNPDTARIRQHTFTRRYYWAVSIRIPIESGQMRSQTSGAHRIVYESWVGPIPEDYQVNHIDGRKWNNWLSNLEAITPYANYKHAMDNNLRYTAFTDAEIHQICRYMQKADLRPQEIAQLLGRDYLTVKNVIKAIMQRRAWYPIASQYDLTKYRNTEHRYDFPPEKIHEICRLWCTGKYNHAQIAERVNVPRRTVSDICSCRTRSEITSQYDMAKGKISRRILSEEEMHLLCQDIMKRMSVADLAAKWNHHPKWVRDVLCRRLYPEIGCQYNFESVYPKENYAQPYTGNQQPST